MRGFQVLPRAVLLLCWAAGVNSENVPIPSVQNGTATSQSSSVTSNIASITTGPTSSPTITQPPTTFTGTDPTDLVDFCFSDYGSYLNASGTPSVYTSSHTGTYSWEIDNITTISTFSNTYTATTTLWPVGNPYTPPQACHHGCIIQGERVRLEYWPTSKINGTAVPNPVVTPAPSVVVDGMTLVSPSNYLVFTGLSAVDCPWGGSPCTTIGQPVNNFTLSFGQNELMTENCFHAFDTFNYADFSTPIPWSIVSTQIGCTLIRTSHPGNEPDYDFTLLPNILYPSAVRTEINPDWAACTFVTAAYDPPSALSPVHQLTSAAPGTTVDPPIPPPTPTVTPSLPPALPETSSSLVQTPDPPPSPTTTPDPPPVTSSDPPTLPPPTTVIPDPPVSSVIPIPPTSSAVPDPPVNSDPAPPADPTSAIDPGDPVGETTRPVADPTTAIDPGDPVGANTSPPAGPPTQSPQGQPGSPGLGSIIASVGGISAPTPGSTITLPGQNTVIGAPLPLNVPAPVTTIAGITTSIEGVATTLPGVIVTGAPAASPPASPVVATIGGNTITIAPDGGSAIVGGQTATAGGAPITVSSTVVSLGESSIVVGSSTVAFAKPTGPTVSNSGYNITTASASGPLQVSSGHVVGVRGGLILSIAFTALLALIQV